ncbi:MAG: ral secretory system protein domain protein [Labilithrix sp.]|nr:ral secretory system protein domain protein [Labilithrix sp.]
MSSMSGSRSPGDKPEADAPQSKRPASPGRYSLSTEGSSEMAAVRIDSTRMPAVRPDAAPGTASRPPSDPTIAATIVGAPAIRETLPQGMETVGPLPARASASAPAKEPPARVPPPLPVRPSGSGSRPTMKLTSEAAGAEPPKGTGAAALAGARKLTPPPASKSSWLPPPPPPKRDSHAPPGNAAALAGFDEGSIAFAFDALMSEGTSGVPGNAVVDLAPVRELFAELAANHMRHVRDFMIDVKWGEATREWIEICIPAVTSLRRAAERLELAELALGLDRFGAQLRATAGDTSRTIEGTSKERLLDDYGQLVAILPQAFALDRDKSQREAVIIQSLCLSVPDVRKVTIDKLHAAGLTSLKTLFDAKADEVSQVAGIPESLALRIVERFQGYRHELQNASPQDARAAERERLTALTTQLREQHDGYEEAARGWSPDAKAKKRDLFRGREETWLAISLLLARFGEVERLSGIEKVPFAQRIAQLTEYLEEAREKYRADG